MTRMLSTIDRQPPSLSKEKSQMGSSMFKDSGSNKFSEERSVMPPAPSLEKATSSFFKTPSAPEKDKLISAAIVKDSAA